VIVHVTFAEGQTTLADCQLQLGCYGEVNALVRAACDQFHAKNPDRSLFDGVTVTFQRAV
jgi:hypothetical protein